LSEVRILISLKAQLDEAVATVRSRPLTTTEMGFSLTDKSHMVICSRDGREGKVKERLMAPAISKFAIAIQTAEEREPTMDGSRGKRTPTRSCESTSAMGKS
jgi:hypothetical protein